MDADIPTYNELQRSYQDTLAATVPECDADDPNGFFHKLSHALAQIDLGDCERTANLGRNGFRGTADRPSLIRISQEEIGAPLSATSAEFDVQLRGDAGEAFPSGIELLHEASGVTALTLSGGTFGLGGTAVVSARSEPGEAGRFKTDTPLRVIAAPAHVQSDAVVATDAEGGTDEEETEDYRGRSLEFVRRRPAGGREGDLAREARKIDGVDKAVDFPELDGWGSHGVAVCGPDNAPVSAPVLTAVNDALQHRDFRHASCKRWFALNSTPLSQDFTLEVSPRPTWAFSDIGTDKVVQGGSTAETIYPDDMTGLAVGKWVAINGEARRIDLVDVDHVVLEAALSAAPSPGDAIAAGSPIYETLYARVFELFYSLDPGQALAPGMESDRFKLVELVDFVISEPASTVVPNVNADTVEILVPGTVRIIPLVL